MTSMQEILVLKGGTSSERAISLKTASHVENALERLGVKYRSFALGDLPDLFSLSFDGVVYVFNAMHGGYGENGTLQGVLDSLKLPYNGVGREASAIGMSKTLTRLMAASCGIHVAQGMWFPDVSAAPTFTQVAKQFGLPFIVKADAQGCSIGVHLVNDEKQFFEALEQIHGFGDRILIEQFLKGEEITVGMLRGTVLPILRIQHAHAFFSHDAKFHSAQTTEYRELDATPELKAKIEISVRRVCSLLAAQDYIRFDFIIRDGEPYLLEINTLPGLNSHSVFVKSCAIVGVSYDTMISRIINRDR